LFFALGTTLYLRDISYFLVTTLMPETPVIVFSVVILLVSAYAVNAGLEVIARLSEIIGPIMFVSLIVVFVLNLNQVELEKLLPLFQHSPIEVFKESLRVISVFGICIVMGMFMAYHNNPKEALKAKLTAITIASVLAIMMFLQLISVLGVNMSSLEIYPVFRLVKYIEAGDFFQRIEPLMVVFWIAGTFIAISILYYNSVLGLAQVLKLPKYQPLTPFIGGVILLTSVFGFQNVTELNLFYEEIFPYGALFVENVLMLLLFAISYLRHGKRQKMLRKGRNDP
jgi:spore germination protein (amino acid permease)